MNEELILPDVRNEKFFFIAGIILSVFTLMMFYIVNYSYFFERSLYIKRRALLKWLKNNKLPDPEIAEGYTEWIVGQYEITLSESYGFYVYNKNGDLELHSYRYSIIYGDVHNKILKILKRERSKHLG